MHHILHGILNSNYPDDVKHTILAERLIPAASNPMSKDNCKSLLETSWELAINGDSEFTQTKSIQVFKAWCEHHKTALAEFLTPKLLNTSLSKQGENKDKMLQIIEMSLIHLKDHENYSPLCCIIQTKCLHILKENPSSIQVTKALVNILNNFPECIPERQHVGELCTTLTLSVVSFPLPPKTEEVTSFITDVSKISSFLKSQWTSEQAIKKTLEVVHCILTSNDTQFSVTLAAIMDLLPPELVNTASTYLTKSISSGNIKPLSLATTRLISCLGWPGTANLHVWVIAAIKGLVSTRCFSAIKEIFENKIEQVFTKMFHPLTRHSALPVMSYMLLSYQHSAVPFHKIAPQIPELIKAMKTEKKASDEIAQVANLAQILIYLHSGFPDLYDPILDAIKEIPEPEPEQMQHVLTQHRMNIPGQKYISGITEDNIIVTGRETDHVGLVNLGNTCYLNSVLQALYMTVRLRHEVLQHKALQPQVVLKKLQEVFAFLTLTQRPAYCPEEFLHATKPPWFESGEQQDCSEFLRHLIDCSHEEQREIDNNKKGTLMDSVFGGETKTIYTCLKCSNVSAHVEKIRDFHLAFPEGSGEKAEPKSYKTRSSTKTPPKVENCNSEENKASLSLEDLIENYFRPELMNGENSYHCEKCDGLQEAERNVQLITAPEHLILTLMRFSYDAVSHSRTKILTNISYPLLISLPANSGLEACYALYAVVVHSGTSAERGHYYTYARHSSQKSLSPRKSAYRQSSNLDPLSKKWYLFNDSRVSHSSYEGFQTLTHRFPKDTAYVLFYKRIDSNFACQEQDTSTSSIISSELQDLVDLDNVKYIEEQEAKNKRARWSLSKSDNWDFFDGSSPPTGGCGGGGGLGGLENMPRVVF